MIATIIMTMFMSMSTSSQIDSWTPGDTNNYRLSVSVYRSTARGTLKQYIVSKSEDYAWVAQDVNILGSRHKALAQVDRDGKIIRLIVDDQEQKIDESEIEVIESRPEKLVVPAGTFDAIYYKAKEKTSENTHHAWINSKDVPIGGIIKMHTTKDRDITTELVSYLKK